MVQFRGGFISGQTGDRCEKPETESPESQENRKSGGTLKVESRKISLSYVVRESRSM